MSDAWHPTLEEFLAAPPEQVASVAPGTMIYSNGGSRRAAALAGIQSNAEYARQTLPKVYDCLGLFLGYGVRHLFVPMLMPNQYNETTPGYRENIEGWVAHAFAGSKAIELWQAKGWRVRLLGAEDAPALQEPAARLMAETLGAGAPTIWIYVVPEPDLQWKWAFASAARAGAQTRAEAARALYGEDIPPATLFYSYGKPGFNLDLLPPLVVGDLQAYWTQKPGYGVTDADFRAVLYDYAFLRQTWEPDKTGRAESAIQHRAAWENGPIIGLGKRLGSFWYPQSISDKK